MKYYIAYNRAFKTRAEAENYCIACDLDADYIEEAETVKRRYYRMTITNDDFCSGKNTPSAYHKYYTDEDLKNPDIQKYIEQMKSNDYFEKFVLMTEITEAEYLKYKA